MKKKIQKVLVANRGEIAIRIFRSCVELGVKTVGVYTFEDRYSLHRYKADESYQIGDQSQPLKPYLDIQGIIALAKEKQVDAIHPGYGFLSENAEFAKECAHNGIVFIGPDYKAMDALGNKIKAKILADKHGVPTIPSSQKELKDLKTAQVQAQKIGYPLMLKAASGGGGRGMRILRSEKDLEKSFLEARREAKNAFGDDTLFLEKFIETPKHIEVQIVADHHGHMIHLFERDCSLQRRHQKVIEMAPAFSLNSEVRSKLHAYAMVLCKAVNYNNIGTVEFLVDQHDNIFFIEVNPRIQVEHTVTEMITGIDLVKSQIMIASGEKLTDNASTKSQENIKINGFAIQCRVTTEDPAEGFKPDYGTITTYRSATGYGIRLDEGSVYQGAMISPFFDSMLVKITSHSSSFDGAIRKINRALKETRIRGVKTNIGFLLNILKEEAFKKGRIHVDFIKQNPALFQIKRNQDRASKIVQYLGDIIVNGNSDVKQIPEDLNFETPLVPSYDVYSGFPKGSKNRLDELGPDAFIKWIKQTKHILYTDTTLRDAHQSLLATRMRTYDMLKVVESYAKHHPEIFSLEVWGGATFDVCLRFLHENPWSRLTEIRKRVPNILLQMLLRGSNAVGYSSYPDNLIEKFIEVSFEKGIDVFRIFDSQNWMRNMETSIQTVRNKTKGIAQVCICYTGDVLDLKKTKYNLEYYITKAKEVENAGAHMIAIKDMAGLLKPYAAQILIEALKDAVNIPIQLHTHDTSSLQTATYLKAIEANVDVVDVALGGLSGLTSQPNFNAVVEMMKFHPRAQKINTQSLQKFSNYFEKTRAYYSPFESGLKASTAEVFTHEIPGGQYSNLKPQAKALGLEDRFEEIKEKYAQVNHLFGDVIKVTPSSKVVGDMAQFLVTNNIDTNAVLEKGDVLSFPESVQAFFRGDLGQPEGGFPKALQRIILKDQKPYTEKPNDHLPAIDFDAEFDRFKTQFQKGFSRTLELSDFLSYKLYPKVWQQAFEKHSLFGDISKIPTQNFFYGMQPMEETIIEIAEGKTIIVKLLSIGPVDANGMRMVFFKVNGQTRNVLVKDQNSRVEKIENVKADKHNAGHIAAPLQGLLSQTFVKKGDQIKKNQPLAVIEAMKMETTITAPFDGLVSKLHLKKGAMIQAEDLILEIDQNVS